MSMITNDWLDEIQGEFKKPYYRELYQFVRDEYSKAVIYPPADDIFNAMHFTPLSKVKVLLLGQDPYHNVNQAHGLSFSVLPEQKEIPPSLQNIYKELHDDLGCYIPNNGYLKKWADQGVLLLNTVLTVRAHQANSHQGHGWEQFTDAIIQAVNAQDRPIVYMLWGRPAQSKHHRIQAHCLRTGDFSDAGISARRMNFCRRMVWNQLTGRLRIYKNRWHFAI